MKLSAKTISRIKQRVYKRYKRFARKIGKPNEWKSLELNGLNFQDALDFELEKERKLAEKGEKSELRHDRRIRGKAEQQFLEGILSGLDSKEQRSNTFIDEDLLRQLNKESPEERRARKEFEKLYNTMLENRHYYGFCPICRCKPCICREEDSE